MKTGVVLEGGASRGVFTTGVVDVFLEKGLTFDYCIGVSAGAGNAMNYKSGQRRRIYTLTADTSSRSYFGFGQIRRSHRFLNLEYLYDTLSHEGTLPFDFDAYFRNPMVCEYVLTNCQTGQAEYIRENGDRQRLLMAVKASCAMPGLCRPYNIGGQHYLDGGITDPMPAGRAIKQGCDRIVLVMTKPVANLRPADYSRMRPLMYRLYGRDFPALYEALMHRAQQYFAQLAQISEWEQEGKVFVIRPRFCDIKVLEKDRDKLRHYYNHGRAVALERYPALLEYLTAGKNNDCQGI